MPRTFNAQACWGELLVPGAHQAGSLDAQFCSELSVGISLLHCLSGSSCS